MATVARQRIPSLDGWRAIAIVLVLLSHEWGTKNAPTVTGALGIAFRQGDLGVRIFLVLSGYLITLLMLREADDVGSFSLRSFYVRRVLRIFPVYFLFLAVLFSLQVAGLYTDTPSSWIGSLSFTRNMVGDGLSATGHLWSLSVEEQFYLLWPLTFAALALHRRPALAVGLLAAVVIGAFVVRLVPCSGHSFVCERVLNVHSAFRYADCLAIGCLGAFVARRLGMGGEGGSVLTLAFLGATAALIASAIPAPTQRWAISGLVTLQAVLTMVALYGSTRVTGAWNGLLNSPVLVQLGVVSYSLYIWHMLFLAHYVGDRVSASSVYDWRVWWIAAVLVAFASYYLFERRFIGLRTHFRPDKVIETR